MVFKSGSESAALSYAFQNGYARSWTIPWK